MSMNRCDLVTAPRIGKAGYLSTKGRARLAKGQGVHAMGDGDTCMVQAFNDEVRELQRFEEKISSAYHRVQPAFETLSPDILEKIVSPIP